MISRVVLKLINANLRIKTKENVLFCLFFSLLVSSVVSDYSTSKRKDKQYKQRTSPKSSVSKEIKIRVGVANFRVFTH